MSAIVISLPYNKIDLTKATMQGLELMLEILLTQEWYEEAAEVRNEIEARKLMALFCA